jgi:hypothetical protein
LIRIRKFSPIDRKHSIFEAVEDDVVLFDVGMTDDDRLEVCFHPQIAVRILPMGDFQTALAEATRLASDKNSN